MQDPFKDKPAYSYPCKPTETCIDYDDYDPCESSEDITEKDLAILLKEEAAKLEREKEKAKQVEGENVKTVKPSIADDKQKQPTQADIKQEEDEESSGKKKTCKYIKNPFFTDRLKLSTSHLPLPPPGPPPQNFPLAGDESVTKICPLKKKKCKKEDKWEKGGKSNDDDGKNKLYEKKVSANEEKDDSLKDGDKEDEAKEDEDGDEDETNGKPCIKKERPKKKEEKKVCKKQKDEKPACRRKESEVSVNFGPRKIPLQLNDPKTSPNDIPEVEQQILMACGKNQEENCKKKCKKKDK